MERLIQKLEDALYGLSSLADEIDDVRDRLREELTALEKQPAEAMKETILQRSGLQLQIRRLTATRLELGSFRGLVRARLNEFDPGELGRMASASKLAAQNRAANPPGSE